MIPPEPVPPRVSAKPAAAAPPLSSSPLLPDVAPPPSSSDAWQLEWLGCGDLRRELSHAGGRVVSGFEYRSDGRAFFLYPDDPVARLTSSRGQTIVLPAQSLFHIERAHGPSSERNRFVEGITPERLLGELVRGLPDEVVYEQREARLEFECEYLVGGDEVAARSKLIRDGRLTRKLADALEPLRSQVFDLNLLGSKEQKLRFVAELNSELAKTPASLVFRRQSILAQYAVPARMTSWFAVVIYHDSQRHRVAGQVGEIRTLYPGRVREPFPSGRWFFAHYGADRASRGLAILDRLAERRPLEKTYELNAVAAQRRAQQFWWEHALVHPDGTKPEEVRPDAASGGARSPRSRANRAR